jgi:hypothetical protein
MGDPHPFLARNPPSSALVNEIGMIIFPVGSDGRHPGRMASIRMAGFGQGMAGFDLVP